MDELRHETHKQKLPGRAEDLICLWAQNWTGRRGFLDLEASTPGVWPPAQSLAPNSRNQNQLSLSHTIPEHIVTGSPKLPLLGHQEHKQIIKKSLTVP